MHDVACCAPCKDPVWKSGFSNCAWLVTVRGPLFLMGWCSGSGRAHPALTSVAERAEARGWQPGMDRFQCRTGGFLHWHSRFGRP